MTLFAEPHGALLPFGDTKAMRLALLSRFSRAYCQGPAFRSDFRPRRNECDVHHGSGCHRVEPPEQFCSQVDQLTEYVKTSRSLPGRPAVMIPGEPDRAEAARRAHDGIRLNERA